MINNSKKTPGTTHRKKTPIEVQQADWTEKKTQGTIVHNRKKQGTTDSKKIQGTTGHNTVS